LPSAHSNPLSGLVQSAQPSPTPPYVCLEDIDVYFAFCFPYTYEEMKRDMDSLDLVFSSAAPSDDGRNTHNIYYHRETMFVLFVLFCFFVLFFCFVLLFCFFVLFYDDLYCSQVVFYGWKGCRHDLHHRQG
jgi:hypothetical protein